MVQRRSIKRRQEILQAALACFSELGYEKTTMAIIRERSKASTGSIYHHFKSKEQLAGALYVEGIIEYQSGFLEVVQSSSSARDGIIGAVRYHMSWVVDHPDWARFLFTMRHTPAVAATEPTLLQHNERFNRDFGRWLRPYVQSGRIRRMPRDVYIAVMWGPCMDFSRQWLRGRVDSPLDEAVDAIARATWRSLRGEGAG